MSIASLTTVIDQFCERFPKYLSEAKKLDGKVFKAHEDSNLRCTFYYNGDAIVDSKVTNAWCDHKYTDDEYSFTGDGSYHPESIYIDMFHERIMILYNCGLYRIDCSYFSDEPSESEAFQYSTIDNNSPPNLPEEYIVKLVHVAKMLTPPEDGEMEFWL